VANYPYHGFAGLSNNHQTHNTWRASASYITGAHLDEGRLRGRVRSHRHLRQLRHARPCSTSSTTGSPTGSRSASRHGSRPTARATTRSTSRTSGRCAS
jgi:hypothetical protein